MKLRKSLKCLESIVSTQPATLEKNLDRWHSISPLFLMRRQLSAPNFEKGRIRKKWMPGVTLRVHATEFCLGWLTMFLVKEDWVVYGGLTLAIFPSKHKIKKLSLKNISYIYWKIYIFYIFSHSRIGADLFYSPTTLK